jgi:hypothetical protein
MTNTSKYIANNYRDSGADLEVRIMIGALGWEGGIRKSPIFCTIFKIRNIT